MNLTKRLVVRIVACIVLVLATVGALEIRQEIALFEEDIARDHEMLGRALGHAARDAWAQGGDAYAELLSAEVAQGDHLRIRWLPAQGAVEPDSTDSFQTIVPVEVDGVRVGAFEIAEPKAETTAYVRRSIVAGVATIGFVIAVSAILVSLLGARYVGVPTRKLVAKARRLGDGDFSNPLRLETADELGEVGRALDTASSRLAEAKRLLDAETSARIEAVDTLRHAERLATVGRLSAGIAHELGTPLNVISAHAEILTEDSSAPARVRENAAVILEQSDRLAVIARQLLDFTRRRPLVKARGEIGPVVQRSIAMLGSFAREREIEVVAPTFDELHLDIDTAQIEQVLTNLIMNAIQATSAGGRIDVEVARSFMPHPEDRSSRSQAVWVLVRIRDTGHGISDQQQKLVFEPFYTTKPIGEGTGLGLAVAHGIVSEHGGFITLDSEVGVGSTFTVYLPTDDDPRPRDRRFDTNRLHRMRVPSHSGAPRSRK